LTDHLIEHDYNLVDLDGKPDAWGEWSREFYQTEEGKYESALRSLNCFHSSRRPTTITGDKNTKPLIKIA